MESDDLLAGAMASWERQLVDNSGRNPLLSFRSLRAGTLTLRGADAFPVQDRTLGRFLGGNPVTVSRLFDGDDIPAVLRRCRNILSKSNENFEEKGLSTLFVFHGKATWSSVGSDTFHPAAPVLLHSLTMEQKGRGEDYLIDIATEWELNPSFVHLMKSSHNIDLASVISAVNEASDLSEDSGRFKIFQMISGACESVPGFRVDDYVAIGNFTYSKLPMVQDLHVARDKGLMAGNPLVMASAGGANSLRAVRERSLQGKVWKPDEIKPADEFLVFDADFSQSEVINSVLAGRSLVVEGPPGSGKSQTIANLIAALAARNKKVLFVAEKRAAIDAVLSRLAKVGLSDIVLDLHSNAVSRRALYQQIADALENHGRIGKQDTEDNERKLEESRRVLAEHKRVMHELHKPWGVSVFDCQSALVGLSRFAPKTRFRSDVIENLGKAERIRIHELLDTFVSLDGLGMESSGRGASPWGNAYRVGDISNIDTAAETLETLQDLRDHLLPDLVKQIRVACEQTGLREPVSISEIDVMLGLWESTQKILSTWEPAVFDLPTATMLGTLQNTSGAARMFSALGNSPYKQAVNALKEACGNRLHQKQLAEELGNVVALQSAWVEVSEGGASPCLPILKKPAELRTQYADACLVLNQVMGRLGFPEWAELSPDELQDLVSALLESSDALYRMPQLTKTKRDLDDVKMGPLIEDMVAQGVSGDDAADFFDYVWYVSIVEYLSLRNPTVASFRGESHQSVVAKFRIADKNHIQSGPARVRRAVAEHAISTLSNYPNQEIIIKKQARLKGRHMPPRLLFEQAGQATRAVKPCWAMSPLVVAQLLPMEQAFDVVIFDEASQVRPAEALGAILRGKQVVVAGDPKQLPPTAFFLSSDSGEVDYDSEETLSAVTDVESILDVMSTLLAPPHGTKMLRWHYRSEDEKLIAFSNAQRSLYNWSLATFPGASSGNSLRHVLVNPPASPTPQSQSVVAEAQEVIKLICEHAATRPQESLGVIAMGTKHAEVINDLLFSEIQRNNALAEWIEGGPPAHRGEKLFVKNLERVQGDERDCIILTVGYGKSPDGRMMYRFGPLNMEGGERRLNVAITRARKHMTVVSSFSSREMDPAKLKAEGAQMLQRYLAYVETQGRDLGPTVLEKPDLNPFERDVQRRLENAGIPLIPQYGASGYWIDFAAQHPTRPGHMVLAIECDGATYHSSPSARDSDRLRQQHLERLGWTFHRIWSTDWFRNPEQETERAVKAWEKAVRLADFENNLQKRPAKSTNRRPPEPQNRPVAGEVAASQRKGPMPIPEERIGKPIDSHSETELIQLIEWISSDGLLRTDEQILDEAVKLLGYKQKGSRIKLRIKEAIRKAK